MPAILFDWNNLDFNHDPANPGHNGIAAQTQVAIVANLTANGAVDYVNHGFLFIFQSDDAIRVWSRNVKTNISWYDIYLCDLDN